MAAGLADQVWSLRERLTYPGLGQVKQDPPGPKAVIYLCVAASRNCPQGWFSADEGTQ
jgi:hypothetical protein